jgi:hypothetical protein
LGHGVEGCEAAIAKAASFDCVRQTAPDSAQDASASYQERLLPTGFEHTHFNQTETEETLPRLDHQPIRVILSSIKRKLIRAQVWSVDALAEAAAAPDRAPGERWVVEVKWRNRRADYHDVAHFRSTALDLNARPWFIAKTGLTPAAAEYAREQGILVSTERDLQLLAERLGVRFSK